jgi:hypothetical protein
MDASHQDGRINKYVPPAPEPGNPTPEERCNNRHGDQNERRTTRHRPEAAPGINVWYQDAGVLELPGYKQRMDTDKHGPGDSQRVVQSGKWFLEPVSNARTEGGTKHRGQDKQGAQEGSQADDNSNVHCQSDYTTTCIIEKIIEEKSEPSLFSSHFKLTICIPSLNCL